MSSRRQINIPLGGRYRQVFEVVACHFVPSIMVIQWNLHKGLLDVCFQIKMGDLSWLQFFNWKALHCHTRPIHNSYIMMRIWQRKNMESSLLVPYVFISQLDHDDVIKWKYFPRYWPFVRGISPHKDQWRGAFVFSLICVWINGWVNNREAGDLRRHRTHYDVILMQITFCGTEMLISLNIYIL